MKTRTYLTGIVFSALGFFYIMWVTTNFDLGVSPDSTLYFETAENILKSGTFTSYSGQLVTQFPPLYALTLAACSKLLNTDILSAATYLSAISLAAAMFLANLVFRKYRFTGRTVILLNVFLFLSIAFSVFLMAWSEPLFIVMLLCLLLVMCQWLESNNRWLLLAAGVITGLMICTRYAGVGIAGGIMLFLFFRRKAALAERLKDVVAFSLITAIGPAIWSIHAITNAASPTGPTKFAFHLISIDHMYSLVRTFGSWLSPAKPTEAIVVIVLALVMILILYALFKMLRGRSPFIQLYGNDKYRLLVYLTATYIAFLLVSVSLFNFSTPLDNRILSPIYPFCLLLAVPMETPVRRSLKVPTLSWLLILGILFLYGYRFYDTSKSFYAAGIGYSGADWTHSASIESLDSTENAIVYSNAQEVVRMRGPVSNLYLELPLKENPVTKAPSESFSGEMQKMHDDIMSGKGVLVFLSPLERRTYYATRPELLKEYEGFKIEYYQDGFKISAAE